MSHRAVREKTGSEVASGEPTGTSGQPVPDVANGTPFMVDTGTLAGVSLVQTGGLESLWVRGPWSLQSEAMGTWVDGSTMGNGFLYGAFTGNDFLRSETNGFGLRCQVDF